MNHGSGPTVYVNVKRPTPTLLSVTAYPPMRASTEATFELVSTLPVTRSPGCTARLLIAMLRIRGAASGGKRGTALVRGAAARAITTELGTTIGAGVGVARNAAIAAPAPGVARAAGVALGADLPRAAGGAWTLAGERAAAVACCAGAPLGWLHPPRQSQQTVTASPRRTCCMARCFSVQLRVPLGKRARATR